MASTRPATSDGREEPIPVNARTLLVVEGKDERSFFLNLMEHLGVTGVQALPYKGAPKLPSFLRALVISPGFGQVTALAVVRDADDDPAAAFQSVCGALGAAHLPVPAAEKQWIGTEPQVAVMILPGNGQRGALEDLCMSSVQADPAIPCVGEYLECVRGAGVPVPRHLSKAKAQVFLASRTKVCLRVGEAASAGYWPFDDPAFGDVSELIRYLGLLAGIAALI